MAWHAKVFFIFVLVDDALLHHSYIHIGRYYTTEFNWNFNVVTIKQREPLSKFDKWWMGKPMCIEGTSNSLSTLKFRIDVFYTDPFNLDHNLGGGISNRSK